MSPSDFFYHVAYTHTHIRAEVVMSKTFLTCSGSMGPPPDTLNYVEDRGRSGNLT